MKHSFLLCLVVVGLAVWPRDAMGQGLVTEALASFPPQTVRIEYSSPTKLRALPNYASLRQRYVGARLVKLEASLADLGVVEGDIDDLILGWRPGAGALDLYGFASGRFNPAVIEQRAKERKLDPETVEGHPAFCLEAGLAASCVIVLDKTLGAFGTLSSLTALFDARGGGAPALSSNESFASLLRGAETRAPIWGVALGSAATDWFKGWMPGQQNVQLDWASVFQKVEALTYNVEASDKVSLHLKLDCESPEAAASLRQVLEGLKLVQQIAWQSQNPSRPNPFEAMDVALANRQIALNVTTAYSALDGVGFSGAQ